MTTLMVGGVEALLYLQKTRFYWISSMNGIITPSNFEVGDIFDG
jgi:hypothetical protein